MCFLSLWKRVCACTCVCVRVCMCACAIFCNIKQLFSKAGPKILQSLLMLNKGRNVHSSYYICHHVAIIIIYANLICLKMSECQNTFAQKRALMCVCPSFHGVPARIQLWGGRQAPFNWDREAEGAQRGGGELLPQGPYTLSHVLSTPSTPPPPASLVTWWALRAARLPPHPKNDAWMLSDSFINDGSGSQRDSEL